MRIKINKNKAGIHKRDKPSRFLVELKNEIEDLREKEEENTRENKTDKKGLFFYRFFVFFKKKIKSRTNIFNIDERKKKTFKKTAFFPIINIFLKVIGIFLWLINFFVRFFYFSFLKIISFLSKSIESKKGDLKEAQKNNWGHSAYIPEARVLGRVSERESQKRFFSIKGFFRKIKPEFSFYYIKKSLFFSLVLFLISLPLFAYNIYGNSNIKYLRGRVLGASEDVIGNLSSASKSVSNFDFISAQDGFVRASDDLLSIKIEMQKINSGLFFLASLVPNQKIKLAAEGKKIINAGLLGSEIGDDFSMAISAFSGKKPFMDSLNQFHENISLVHQNTVELNKILKSIDISLLPEEYREQVLLLRDSLDKSAPLLSEIIDLSEKLKVIVGAYEGRRYLFIFQNNSELRASGGFIGSFALVDFSNGEIKNIEVPGGGSYDTEGGLREFVVAPEPLHLVNPLWHFWDANWWPDFKKTAKKLMWFYERSGGPSVDGVISFTPDVIENILSVIGPIDMTKDYGLIIDSDNFWIETQRLAEQKPDLTKKPKKIIGDLMDTMIDELPKRINEDNIFDLLKIGLDTLNEKKILFYFIDDDLENKVREYSWSGEVEDSIYDYLMVVNTNIAGGKSDRVIDQKIYHNAEINENGDIYDTVTVERKHNGVSGDEFVGVRNNSWMRFYVPLGSELISAKGFWPIDEDLFEKPEADWEIDEDLIAERNAYIDTDSWTKVYTDSGKTVFANWAWVDPGETVTVSIKYKLPFKIDFEKKVSDNFYQKLFKSFTEQKEKLSPYSLMIQKQAGTKNDFFSSSLKITGNQNIVWSYGTNDANNAKGWNLRGQLNRDKYWAVLLSK